MTRQSIWYALIAVAVSLVLAMLAVIFILGPDPSLDRFCSWKGADPAQCSEVRQ